MNQLGGKLDVQIKTLPGGASSFQCSSKLFAYSKVTTAPLLLICVDTANHRAYWKHIHADMKDAKGKEKQKSFVVRFDGSIDNTKGYIIAWEAICEQFQSRLLTGGSCIGFSMQVNTGQGSKLHPRWEQKLRHILLPIEKNKKALKAALKYAHGNATSGWADFISALQTQVVANNADPSNSQLKLEVHPSQSAGNLQYKSAMLFF